MSTTNLDIFRNGTFDFEVVGARYTVHKDLVARNSSGLKGLMESGMQESRAGSAPLQDTDELTFGRFVEFMYTGDYNPGEPVKVETEPSKSEASDLVDSEHISSPSNDLDVEPESPAEDRWIGSVFSSRPSKKKKKQSSLMRRRKMIESGHLETTRSHSPPPMFSSLYCTANMENPFSISSIFESNGDWNLDYLPVFLSHAQLYVFADTYDIPSLQTLTAVRLHDALSIFQYSEDSVTNVAELVSYAYDHTPDRKDDVDRLRIIVTHFCAVNAGALKASTNFRELLKEGGDFTSELFRKMCEVYGGFPE